MEYGLKTDFIKFNWEYGMFRTTDNSESCLLVTASDCYIKEW